MVTIVIKNGSMVKIKSFNEEYFDLKIETNSSSNNAFLTMFNSLGGVIFDYYIPNKKYYSSVKVFMNEVEISYEYVDGNPNFIDGVK